MIGRAIAAAALLVLAAACNRGSCDKRVATFQSRLEKALAWDTGPEAIAVELMEIPGARPLDRGRSLTIGILHSGLVLNHRTVPANIDDVGLAEMIALEREAHRLTAGDAPMVVELWVDRRAPLSTVRRMVDQFTSGEELRLVARIPGELDIPAAPERVAETLDPIQEGDPSQRATTAASVMEKAIGSCKPAAEVFGELARVDVTRRSALLGEKLGPAVARCGCRDVDVPLLEEALVRLFGGREPRRGWVPLDRARLAEAPNVAALYRP